MATSFFPLDTASTRFSSDYTGGPPTYKVLGTARGSGAVTKTTNTVASLTVAPMAAGGSFAAVGATSTTSVPVNGAAGPGVGAGLPFFWISEPINAVTISGTITINMRCLESNAMANYASEAVVIKVAAGNGATIAVGNGGLGTEYGTTEAASNFNITPASTAFAQNDMIMVIFGNGSATATVSASGFTTSFFYGGASGATGDCFVTFTETITLAAPARQPRNPAVNFNDPAFFMRRYRQRIFERGRIFVPGPWVPEPAV